MNLARFLLPYRASGAISRRTTRARLGIEPPFVDPSGPDQFSAKRNARGSLSGKPAKRSCNFRELRPRSAREDGQHKETDLDRRDRGKRLLGVGREDLPTGTPVSDFQASS